MNKKGVVPLIVIIIVLVLLIVGAFLYFKYYKPLKEQRDDCLSKLDNLKKQCNVTIQELSSQISKLKENNSTLSKELDKYKTDVSFTNAKIEIPVIRFPIKVYLVTLVLSLLALVLIFFPKMELNIKLQDVSIPMKILIWISLILNILILIFSLLTLLKD